MITLSVAGLLLPAQRCSYFVHPLRRSTDWLSKSVRSIAVMLLFVCYRLIILFELNSFSILHFSCFVNLIFLCLNLMTALKWFFAM